MSNIRKQHRWKVMVPWTHTEREPDRGEWDVLDDDEWRAFSREIPDYSFMQDMTDVTLSQWRNTKRLTKLSAKVEWRLRKLGWISYNREWRTDKAVMPE